MRFDWKFVTRFNSERVHKAKFTSDGDIMITADLEIDATGLACPLPLLKAKQGLNQLASGQYLRLTATDPGSVRDIRVFAELSPHQLIAFDELDGTYNYLLRKA